MECCCYEVKDSQSKCSPNTFQWKDFHFLQIASNFPQNKKDKYYNNKCNCHVKKKGRLYTRLQSCMICYFENGTSNKLLAYPCDTLQLASCPGLELPSFGHIFHTLEWFIFLSVNV